ncbi:DUF4175 family protein [Flammeovirga yaeyamensis]|uniref:DUF4175 family protein n=1 Tax=Flammeovirga yaeyamensis TaxID=367791 RepID=A0AAX1N3C5_9BACT|nr:DUF4175 family protein [Flammeovirga yaeyamensis]MBB3700664.1 hypothetical protein [Flammeovirga yaeyamensis]NMF37776.1 DUF4175 family protein [Flammeovirga yaeyamensis]QWG02083.1 DUF4175 family protein [Flammeovirga yaeyamensis]
MFDHKIRAYKQKLYKNAALKGIILTMAAVLGLFLLINILEYINNFGTTARAILFFTYILTFAYTFYIWVIQPIAQLKGFKKQITDEEAAKNIGTFFPEISDKLINSIQLQAKEKDNSLIQATLQKRNRQFDPINFTHAISYKENLKYSYWYLLPAVIIFFGILLIKPQIITDTTPKIVQFDKEFLPVAPFRFELLNSDLKTFQGDDFELNLKLSGDVIPADVYLETNKGSIIKLQYNPLDKTFSHTFKKIQHDVKFRFKAAGYFSTEHHITTLTRPSLSQFSVQVDYPRYTGKNNETLSNTGNLLLPEGSKITWLFDTKTADSIAIYFKESDKTVEADGIKKNVFKYVHEATMSTAYSVSLKNIYGSNRDSISYYLNVIPDKFPSINMKQYQDTVMFDYLVFGGNISDDYGITRLRTRYRIKRNGDKKPPRTFEKMDIPFNNKAIDQSFYYKLETNQFDLKEGDKLEYYVEVYDNDAVNGNKRSKTPMYTFTLPTKAELEKEIDQSKKETENKLDDTLDKANQLEKDLKKLEEKLKGKRQLTWQDKKDIQKLIEKRKELEEQLKSLQEQSQQLQNKQDKFSNQDKSTSDKAEQLQKIINDINDEETQKLYEELQKLMEQNYINQNLQENLQNIENKQKNLKNELERTIKLFKKLQIEQKAKEVSSKLEDLAKEQQDLANKTKELEEEEKKEGLSEEEKKDNKSEEDVLKKDQEELNKKFEDIKKEMEELRKMDKKEQTNQDFEQFTPNERQISKEQQNASEQLNQDKKKDAHQSQKKAANKMQQMAQKMQQSMQSSQMEQISEDHEALRQIMENLLKLSFDQENLMESFKEVRRIDPKFVELSQTQLKLKDDAKYIEDSLIALSKRFFQIESFVTREVTQMNKYMDESLDAIKRRVPEIAASKQQFTMTSINNLALLLNDILENMQQQMSQNMAGQQMNQKQQQSSSPSMSQMQQQLNQQMQNLKKSGKSGKELSKELAKLAAQQEMIRNALKQSMGKGEEQMQGKEDDEGEKGGGNGYGKILKEMEKTEEDLVNKRLTDKLIQRQQEILTRMLESEKAKKEKGKDEERKAETAKQQKQVPPPDSFDEYLKQKETQIELLRTIPTSLNTYYKQEVNKYFENIKD